MVAQSLMAGAAALERKTIFHVVVLASSFDEFQSGLSKVMQCAREFFDVSLGQVPDHYIVLTCDCKVIWQHQQDYFQGNTAYCQRGWNSY